MLFDWLYPAHFPAVLACLEAWADVPEVTTALLKFMAEFVLNKTQRLTLDSSSPHGILLFREVSKVGQFTFGSPPLCHRHPKALQSWLGDGLPGGLLPYLSTNKCAGHLSDPGPS